jgi:hypothetical protein
VAAAFGSGTLAASSLVMGALVALSFRIGLRAIGLIMGFGAGELISAGCGSLRARRQRVRASVQSRLVSESMATVIARMSGASSPGATSTP